MIWNLGSWGYFKRNDMAKRKIKIVVEMIVDTDKSILKLSSAIKTGIYSELEKSGIASKDDITIRTIPVKT